MLSTTTVAGGSRTRISNVFWSDRHLLTGAPPVHAISCQRYSYSISNVNKLNSSKIPLREKFSDNGKAELALQRKHQMRKTVGNLNIMFSVEHNFCEFNRTDKDAK